MFLKPVASRDEMEEIILMNVITKKNFAPVPLIICIDTIRQVRGLIKVILRRLILG
jgi:hypothetical protein